MIFKLSEHLHTMTYNESDRTVKLDKSALGLSKLQVHITHLELLKKTFKEQKECVMNDYHFVSVTLQISTVHFSEGKIGLTKHELIRKARHLSFILT